MSGAWCLFLTTTLFILTFKKIFVQIDGFNFGRFVHTHTLIIFLSTIPPPHTHTHACLILGTSFLLFSILGVGRKPFTYKTAIMWERVYFFPYRSKKLVWQLFFNVLVVRKLCVNILSWHVDYLESVWSVFQSNL